MGRAKEWVLMCKACSREFKAYQNNPNTLPKYCDICKFAHHKCPVCGKPVGIYTTYCSPRCAGNDLNNIKIRQGHERQAIAITGDNNPAKREDVRLRISEGVQGSYTPELREMRRRQILDLGVPQLGVYDDGKGNMLRSLLELDVSRFLSIFGFEYSYETPLEVGGRVFFPDFTLPFGTLIEVAGWVSSKESIKEYKEKFRLILEETRKPLIIVTYGQTGYVFSNLSKVGDIDIVSIDDKDSKLSTVMLDGFDTIDYSHTLPSYQGKCNRIHAHSSQILSVEVTGVVDPVSYMVMDFGLLKDVAKRVASMYDHRLVVSKKYTSLKDGMVYISYETSEGKHEISLPSSEVTILEGEATIESMVENYVRILFKEMPDNIICISAKMSEGVGKSCSFSLGSIPKIYNMKDLYRILRYHEWLNSYTKEED